MCRFRSCFGLVLTTQLGGVQRAGLVLVAAQATEVQGLRHSSPADSLEQEGPKQRRQQRRRAQSVELLDAQHADEATGPTIRAGAAAAWAELLEARENNPCSSPPCREGKHIHQEWTDFGEAMSQVSGAVVVRRPDLVESSGISPARSLDYVSTLQSYFPLFKSSLFSRMLLEGCDDAWTWPNLHRFYEGVRSGNDSAGVYLSAYYIRQDDDKLASDGYESVLAVASMANAFISSDGFVWNAKDFVAPNSMKSTSRARRHDTLLPHNAESFEQVVVLTQPWGALYYHFLVESLSRITVVLDVLLDNPDIKVAVNMDSNEGWREYMHQLLELLGVARERVVFVDQDIHADLVILPPSTVFYKPNTAMIMMLRHALLQALYPDTGGVAPALARPVILLIVRTQKRGLQNNDDLREALEREFPSYDVVEFLAQGSIRSQLETFATASVVVGPHGAGLSNILVSSLHTPVLEIGPASCPMCYVELAVKLHHVYARHPASNQPDDKCDHWYEPPVDEVIDLLRDLLEAKRQADAADPS